MLPSSTQVDARKRAGEDGRSACVFLVLCAGAFLHPRERGDHFHWLGGYLFAQNPLEDRTVNLVDLRQPMRGQEHVYAALISQDPGTSASIRNRGCAQGARGSFLGSLEG